MYFSHIEVWYIYIKFSLLKKFGRGVPHNLSEVRGGGTKKIPPPPPPWIISSHPKTNFMRHLLLSFLIWPSKVIPFNTKNKGSGGGGRHVLASPYGTLLYFYQLIFKVKFLKVLTQSYSTSHYTGILKLQKVRYSFCNKCKCLVHR